MRAKKINYSELGLSPLETEILEILWQKKKIKVREMYNILKKKRKLAHTSAAVMLDRLHKKGCAKREIESCKGGFRYIYYPSCEKVEFQRRAVENAVSKIVQKFGNVAINYFDEQYGRVKR